MLFLADEDFPGLAVRWLREAGHDVVCCMVSVLVTAHLPEQKAETTSTQPSTETFV
jgi:hypothetical protein